MFVQEIHELDKPVMLNCDNQGEIVLLKDNKFHAQTKQLIYYVAVTTVLG